MKINSKHYWDMLPNKLQPTIYSKTQALLSFQTIICLDPFNT